MNIFKILASGDGTIKEPNVSAFLAYLLNPGEDHGLKAIFLKKFLQGTGKNIFHYDPANKYEIQPEVILSTLGGSKNRRDIDVVINITESLGQSRTILIENKIRKNSSSQEQLTDLEKATDEINKVKNALDIKKVLLIYLTPGTDEFVNNFKAFTSATSEFQKIHYIWGNEHGGNSVVNMLESILQEEQIGWIEPIHEYTKHTIKGFINFIKSGFRSKAEEERQRSRIEDQEIIAAQLESDGYSSELISFYKNAVDIMYGLVIKKTASGLPRQEINPRIGLNTGIKTKRKTKPNLITFWLPKNDKKNKFCRIQLKSKNVQFYLLPNDLKYLKKKSIPYKLHNYPNLYLIRITELENEFTEILSRSYQNAIEFPR